MKFITTSSILVPFQVSNEIANKVRSTFSENNYKVNVRMMNIHLSFLVFLEIGLQVASNLFLFQNELTSVPLSVSCLLFVESLASFSGYDL